MIKNLLPSGIIKLSEYKRQFEALGLPGAYCLKALYRNALQTTNIELFPREILGSMKTVIDVGANLGDWSTGIAMLTTAERIVAFEPVPEVYEALKKRSSIFPQIECINSAIGAYTGDITINVEEKHQLSSVLKLTEESKSLFDLTKTSPKQVLSRITTLDNEFAGDDEISLLKIDVQGYEPEVLSGGKETLQKTRVLLIEITYETQYEGDQQFADYHDLITKLSGMKLWGISAPKCSQLGRPMWADAVYVQTDWIR